MIITNNGLAIQRESRFKWANYKRNLKVSESRASNLEFLASIVVFEASASRDQNFVQPCTISSWIYAIR